tara:strand:+ start:254 stop:523 length:270 start_codon:yes stop_codon:yes gene_type:complete
MEIKITITDTQAKCLDRITEDKVEWITNCAIARAYTESRDIRQSLLEHCNENDVALAVGEDAQITQAFDLGVVLTAEDYRKKLEESKPE